MSSNNCLVVSPNSVDILVRKVPLQTKIFRGEFSAPVRGDTDSHASLKVCMLVNLGWGIPTFESRSCIHEPFDKMINVFARVVEVC